MDTLLWYLEITLDYVKQMLPCMAIGAMCFLALLLGILAPNLTRKFQVEVRHGRKTGDLRPAPGAGAGEL